MQGLEYETCTRGGCQLPPIKVTFVRFQTPAFFYLIYKAFLLPLMEKHDLSYNFPASYSQITIMKHFCPPKTSFLEHDLTKDLGCSRIGDVKSLRDQLILPWNLHAWCPTLIVVEKNPSNCTCKAVKL